MNINDNKKKQNIYLLYLSWVITIVGTILEKFDFDTLIPAFGFLNRKILSINLKYHSLLVAIS